jgi:HEAT repeat protein
VKLWELATRKERAALGFSEAGKATEKTRTATTTGGPSAAELQDWWTDLGSADAPRAYRAIWSLGEAGKPAVQLIQGQIRTLTEDKPAPVDLARVAKLIGQLDDDEAAVREKATEELKLLGKSAESAMRQALEKTPSAEVDFRLKLLLGHISSDAPRTIHLVRAIEVLENQGTPEARKVLEQLAGDQSKEQIKNEARASLDRLAQRKGK